MNYVRGEGNPYAKLMVIGDVPSPSDFSSGIPFSDSAGSVLNNFLQEAGTNRSEVFLSNVIKESNLLPVPKKGYSSKDIQPSITNLLEEIKIIKPNCILALGELPLQILAGCNGIEHYRGSILLSGNTGIKVVPTIHPDKLVEGNYWDTSAGKKKVFKYSSRLYIQLDINRAIEESLTPTYAVPNRELIVCKDAVQLHSFLNSYTNKTLVSTDIESHNCLPSCIAFAFSPDCAMSVTLTRLISPETPDGMTPSDLRLVWRTINEFFNKRRAPLDLPIGHIGQNFKFDHDKLNTVGFYPRFEHDLMFMSHVLYPEFLKSLEFLTSIHTREPYYKDEGKEYHPKKDPYSRLMLYNAKDAAVTYEVYLALRKELEEEGLYDFYYDTYHPAHTRYMRMERRGLRVDESKKAELIKKYKELEETIQGRLNAFNGGEYLNVNSPPQMARLLYSTLHLPERRERGKKGLSTSEDTIVALMNNVVKKEEIRQVLRDVLACRKTRKTRGTYLEARLDFDSRLRGSYRVVGTETGRSSTSIQEPPVRREKRGIAWQTMTKHGDVGADLRKQYIPDEDKIFVEVDLSQAEARIVALLSEDYDLLELFNQGVDVHKRTASMIFFSRPDKTEKIDKNSRFIGKESRHAGNYDVQKKRFMQMVNTDAMKFGIDVEISEYRAGQILQAFHQMHPKVKEVFHKQVISIANDNYQTLTNPFGRKRQFTDRWNEKTWREMYAFLPQSTVADQLKRAMTIVETKYPDVEYLVEAHDAFLVQLSYDSLSMIDDFISAMEVPIDFTKCSLSRGILKIPCEAQVGINYKELVSWDKVKDLISNGFNVVDAIKELMK